MASYNWPPQGSGGGGGSGTVTSVALAAPSSILSVSGSPITSSGTITLALATQSANLVWAGPTSGSAATPTFRSLVSADLPAGLGTVTSVAMSVPAFLSVSGSPITTSGTFAVSLSGTALPILNGGTGQTTANAAYNALSPMTTLGDIEYEDATPKAVRLAGNITTTKQFLSQTGTGSVSAAPVWSTISGTDLPAITLTGDVTGTSSGASIATSLVATSNTTLTSLSNLVTVGTISTGTWAGTTIAVNHGGTGQTTLATHGVLIGNGTTGISVLAAAAAGTALMGQGSSSNPAFSATPTLGVAGTTSGTLALASSTASTGLVTLANQGTTSANAYTLKFPLTSGTNGYALTTDGTGITTWTSVLTNPMTTGGDIIYGGTSGTPTRLANGTSGQVLQSAGSTSAPAWQTLAGNSTALKAPTVQKFTSTGSTVGYLFTISTSTTCAVGDTYTNNGNTYTVIAALSAQSGAVFWASNASAPQASGTLTRATGSGTSSITFTAATAYATYTTPSGPAPLYIKVELVGGGGGGSGSGTQSGGTSSGGSGTAGGGTFFGANVLVGNGGGAGLGGVNEGSPSIGGTASITGFTGTAVSGAQGAGGPTENISNSSPMISGSGGNSVFGGAGAGIGGNNAGSAAATNSGSGGSGAGYTDSTVSGTLGNGGAAGGYINVVMGSPAASYPYIVGTAGSGGSAGTAGAGGGAGAAGVVLVTEYYQ